MESGHELSQGPSTGLRMSLWSLFHFLFTVQSGGLRLSHTLTNGDRHRKAKPLVQRHRSSNCMAWERGGGRAPYAKLSTVSHYFLINRLFSFSFLRFFPDLEPLPFPLGLSDPQPLPPLPLHFWEHSFKDLQAIETAGCLLCLHLCSQGEAPGAHLNSRYQLCD